MQKHLMFHRGKSYGVWNDMRKSKWQNISTIAFKTWALQKTMVYDGNTADSVNITACHHFERRSTAVGQQQRASQFIPAQKSYFTFQLPPTTIRSIRWAHFRERLTPVFNLGRRGTIFLWPEWMLLGGSAKSLSETTNTLTRVTFIHTSARTRRTAEVG